MPVLLAKEPPRPMLTNRLSRLMGERRVSMAEVARGAGLARRTVFDLYHDRTRRLDFETLDKLCAYFEVTPNDILEWQPDPDAATDAAGERT